MPKNLVIVESPGKVKSIQNYLSNYVSEPAKEGVAKGSQQRETFKVMSSYGHIRDLPKRGLNVDPEHHWEQTYEITEDKAKVVSDLRKEASSADLVFLATDLDREGEAIAWHLREIIGGDEDRFVRVVFNEITQAAIQKAFSERGRIDENLVNAQQVRRILDRVVGYKLTPLLYKKIARNLSAGRVQSVAVRLVVEREREIRAFKPREYWDVFANLRQKDSQEARTFKVHFTEQAKFDVGSEQVAEQVVVAIQASTPTVKSITKQETSRSANPPFITSTLQRTASTQLRFALSKTMRLAQRLYEAGLITYMRTDSTNISAEARDSAAKLVKTKYGTDYLPSKPNEYKSKSNAQEAHEAIRPSDVNIDPDAVQFGHQLGRMQLKDKAEVIKLYDLIWRRFVASQMAPARYENTTVAVVAGEHELRLSGRVTLFDGHTRALGTSSDDRQEPDLPEYKQDEVLTIDSMDKKQHFTRPPARYTEARLVKELEDRGIGRPSTYVSVISTIRNRGYLSMRGRQLHAEPIAEIVTDRLMACFKDLMSYEFTAAMEEQLDEIAVGERHWEGLLDDFYGDFNNKLTAAESSMTPNDPIETDIPCTKCGRQMMLRTGSTGTFLGCSGYSLPKKEQCRNTLDLTSDEETLKVASGNNTEEAGEQESRRLLSKRQCGKCGNAMDGYYINENLKLHICGDMHISCDGMELEHGKWDFGSSDNTHPCNVCDSDMQLTNGRFGPFFRCSNESCGNTRKALPDGSMAAVPVPFPELRIEEEDDYFILREGKAGIFLGASRYPKVRKMRQPLVRELKSHANEIDQKFKHLLDAPESDGSGHDTLVRYNRRTGDYYVVAVDKAGKALKWQAYFNEGRWQPKEMLRK